MVTKKALLKDVAYEKIKQKILRGREDYTSENTLVEELEMSRTPIREALQRLQYEGFIKIISNQGVVIPELSVKETNDLFDMRIAIETFSLKQAVDITTKEDFEAMYRLIEEQKDAAQHNDVFQFIEKDAEFHLYLLDIVGNHLFIQSFNNIKDRLHRTSRNLKTNTERLLLLAEEHIRIIEFIKNKDIDRAVVEMENHLNGGKLNIYGGI